MNQKAADPVYLERERALRGLSPKQRRFAERYAVLGNATQAAIEAGYSPATARQQGPQLTKKPNVREAVDGLLSAAAQRNVICEDRVVGELALLAFDRSGKTATRDRLRALEMLGRYLGMFDNRIKISVDDPDIVEAAKLAGVDPEQVVAEMQRELAGVGAD